LKEAGIVYQPFYILPLYHTFLQKSRGNCKKISSRNPAGCFRRKNLHLGRHL